MKRKVYQLLNDNRYVTEFIYGLIILNVIALMLDSFEAVRDSYHIYLHGFEVFSVLVFTVEYVLRLWTADCEELVEGGPFKRRLAFIFSSYGLIDLIAILPFWLPMFLSLDMSVIRILRLLRLMRIFKLGRFSTSMQMIGNILRQTKSDLAVTFFSCGILIVLSSTLMYYVEHAAQPDQFRNVGNSVWWAVATLTTVGYGDIYPITPLGKLLGAATALIGVGFVALPTAIISSAFINDLRKKPVEPVECTCPDCGKRFTLELDADV